jgi:hypothetical protein
MAKNQFAKRHPIKVSNGHCSKRYVWMEILAIKGSDFIRYRNICPSKCLDFAKSLNDGGHQVTGIYAYYIPFHGYNNYEEAYWISTNQVRGLANNLILADHCCC